ncbi:hypothetical protein M1466_02245 [Candidatus Dependentiae bacterium]|nr:hypothetical protein [Candidatus Dependentiae bacterium]
MLLQLLHDLVMPHYCALCLDFIAQPGLCIACQEHLTSVAPVIIDRARLPVFAATAYTGTTAQLIRAKHRRYWGASVRLAHLMGATNTIARLQPSLIVPVPSHWTRQVWRGYNAAAELGMILAEQHGIAYTQLVVRQRKTALQVGLTGKQRQDNVERAFAIADDRLLSLYVGKHILLVDDLMTTGATLVQVARTIRRHSPTTRISAFVAARVVPC